MKNDIRLFRHAFILFNQNKNPAYLLLYYAFVWDFFRKEKVSKKFKENCFCFFFCLDAKETKNQGKPDRSARFSLPALGKSRWIIPVFFQAISVVVKNDIRLFRHAFILFNQNKDPAYLLLYYAFVWDFFWKEKVSKSSKKVVFAFSFTLIADRYSAIELNVLSFYEQGQLVKYCYGILFPELVFAISQADVLLSEGSFFLFLAESFFYTKRRS